MTPWSARKKLMIMENRYYNIVKNSTVGKLMNTTINRAKWGREYGKDFTRVSQLD